MKNLVICILVLSMGVAVSASGDDLFHVLIASPDDAAALGSIDVNAVARTAGGYLVLAEEAAVFRLETSGLSITRLARDVTKESLALDISHDRSRRAPYEIIFEQDNVRLYRLPFEIESKGIPDEQLAPILADRLPVVYSPPMEYNANAVSDIIGLDSMINLVRQDSLLAYTERLQAFYRRYGGADSNYAASAWIKATFESFGYDSVYFDSFTHYSSSQGLLHGRNVVATKVGATHPQWEIIVGGHHDGVRNSPAADDNGSGTAGVLEIARILADVDTDVTFRFITFDFEEWGLIGAWHYANRAAARGDHIVYMLNMDMIAHYQNDTDAKLFHGDRTAFSELWIDLGDSLAGITGHLSGSSGGSDHYPFGQNGYHVTFVHEYIFSSVYHSPLDSTSYMNFDYMTRMVQASLATVYTINQLPPPVIFTSVVDAGDGQSMQLNWIPMSAEIVDQIRIYYQPEGSSQPDSMTVAGTESSALVTGLTDGQTYEFWALPFDALGRSAAEYEIVTGTPHSIPGSVAGVRGMPVQYGIKISWRPNPELDISHYRIVRDRTLLPDEITDTVFFDYAETLGKKLHDYLVYAVDIDGNPSDTVGAPRTTSKAAWLDPQRVLAVNRSHTSVGTYLVDETETGAFLNEVLAGLDYDYLSDTAHTSVDKTSQLSLYDLIDYGLVVIGGESVRLDDLGASASMGGRLDTLVYYLSIGGKAIIFGRWGEVDFATDLTYGPGSPGYGYTQFFGIDIRHLVLTQSSGSLLASDLIGAHAQVAGYPDLIWDSLLTVQHSEPEYTEVTGIPGATYVSLNGTGMEVLYTYNSSDDGPAEGEPVAWREPGRFVYFEVPLSCMDRATARAAMAQALLDFGFAPATTGAIPDVADIWADDTAVVAILLGNLVGGYTAYDVDQSSVLVNDSLVPDSFRVETDLPGFEGAVLAGYLSSSRLAASYGQLMCDGNEVLYDISWRYTGEPDWRAVTGSLVVNGYKRGDANTDGILNVSDAVYLIGYIFKGGAPPYPQSAGDANDDGGISVGDAVYIVNYVFKGGPAPVCGG